MPEVIVIDEIGTEQEAFASRTIAERGVQLVATAHGNSLENLLMNPTLSDLVGGIAAVTLSDEEAKRRGTQKTVLERKAPPTFEVVIEIMDVNKLAIHHNVEETVDRFLRGAPPRPEIRVRNAEGEIEVVQRSSSDQAGPRPVVDEVDDDFEPLHLPAPEAHSPAARHPDAVTRKRNNSVLRIFPYGVNRNRLDRAILESHVSATIARDIREADVVIALKASYRREPARMRDAQSRNLPTHIVKSNTYAQVVSAVRDIFQMGPLDRGYTDEALREAEEGVRRVAETGVPVELRPQNGYNRRMQHQLVVDRNLVSESVGDEPQRRVRILPV